MKNVQRMKFKRIKQLENFKKRVHGSLMNNNGTEEKIKKEENS